MAAAIEAEGLVKRYGPVTAVAGISFRVESGQAVALLGPNGAGKTTTMRLVACLSWASEGRLAVLGVPAHPGNLALKRRLGVVGQDDHLDPDLTAEENIVVYGKLYGLSTAEARRRARELLAFMDLEARARSAVRELSGGMRRRLAIARGLVGRPDLLVLDEPTTGLDPTARRLVWESLRRLAAEGVTLFFSTHYMEEAERLADTVLLMRGGRIWDRGSPAELVERWASPEVLEIEDEVPAPWLAEWLAARRLGRVERQAGGLWVFTDRADAVLAGLAQAGRPLRRYRRRPGNLEDVFVWVFQAEPAVAARGAPGSQA
jgi:lipooligosaccharide transport system ATP-binding protein